MILQKNFLKTNNFTRRGACRIILARAVITFVNIRKGKQEVLRVLQPGLSDAVLGMISYNLLNKYDLKIRQTIRDNAYSIVTLAIVFCGKALRVKRKISLFVCCPCAQLIPHCLWLSSKFINLENDKQQLKIYFQASLSSFNNLY